MDTEHDEHFDAGADDAVATPVTVAIRVKAPDPHPDGGLDDLCVFPDAQAPLTSLGIDSGGPRSPMAFSFDSVHWSLGKASPVHVEAPEASQATIFENLGVPIVESVLNGYNSCIFGKLRLLCVV